MDGDHHSETLQVHICQSVLPGKQIMSEFISCEMNKNNNKNTDTFPLNTERSKEQMKCKSIIKNRFFI